MLVRHFLHGWFMFCVRFRTRLDPNRRRLWGTMGIDHKSAFASPAHSRIDTATAALAGFLPVCFLAIGFLTIGAVRPAQALPSFARQTGQPCGACHTDFPTLTPYGRRFKLLGYTTGGGKYQTTPFPDSNDSTTQKEYVPPVSMMSIIGYTHTQASLPPPVV